MARPKKDAGKVMVSIGAETYQVERAALVEYLTARMAGMDHAVSEPLLKTVKVTASFPIPVNGSPLAYRELLLKFLNPPTAEKAPETPKTKSPKSEKAVA